ncbi:sugar phosphate isomerase/epimerase family protein [Paenibacillus mucilaginosus]|uniref:Xylose isomerase domain protein TIM barrel n=1 Tax=Paenibacillus mucilaginosus (strain KNP414) TaxID=1036673 RepID=F8FK51_PAEMK|nr:TIM barrel protein [Paenibacillus mucilaginosus]AEI44092.1 Xylose isomerase domain protein TIM barrel [Paenibacillus mucilaginosus KNP414]MCG7212431.1 sugar phosphate isomerase/epimerase [Paenibacillus mucilaginosus]WDM25529.1 TIM barrel protein [Paenibacillus mucilaginosus]
MEEGEAIMIDKGAYSFSTCWNIKRHTGGRELIEEIRALGFRRVELNYNITQELLKTIEPMIERGDIGVSSVHNVFPFVNDKAYDTDSVMLGYDDEGMRRRSVDLLLQSMEYAHRYGAEAVVVHPGEVPFESNIDAELKQLWQAYGPQSPQYRALWERMMERRSALAPRYVQRIAESLEEVCEEAARRGWNAAVGIETRSRCYQIPTLREAAEICGRLQGAPVHLWLDTGHAMMMQRMGLYDAEAELGEIKRFIYGVHIHETLGLSDHWCPYVHSGEERFFDPYLEAIACAKVKVYELKAACLPEDIHKSHRLLTGRLQALESAAG